MGYNTINIIQWNNESEIHVRFFQLSITYAHAWLYMMSQLSVISHPLILTLGIWMSQQEADS